MPKEKGRGEYAVINLRKLEPMREWEDVSHALRILEARGVVNYCEPERTHYCPFCGAAPERQHHENCGLR